MSEENDQMVPISRLNAKQAKIDAALRERDEALAGTAAAVEAAVGEWRAKYEAERTAHKTTVTESATKYAALEVAGVENAALTAAGITNEKHVRIARMLYADSDDEKKGEFAEWLPKAAASDDVLSVLLTKAATEDAGTPEEPEATPAATAPPSTNGGAKPVPPAGGSLTLASYNEQLDKYIASGESDKARELQTRWANG